MHWYPIHFSRQAQHSETKRQNMSLQISTSLLLLAIQKILANYTFFFSKYSFSICYIHHILVLLIQTLCLMERICWRQIQNEIIFCPLLCLVIIRWERKRNPACSREQDGAELRRMTLTMNPQLRISVTIGLTRWKRHTGKAPTNFLSQRRIRYFKRIVTCSKNEDK